MVYTATYSTADISSQVIDFVGGIMGALAQSANPLVWLVVGTLVVGMVGTLLYSIKNL